MSETISGGAYLSTDGKTWHDANGEPLSREQVAEAKALLAEKADQREAEEQANQARLAASQKVLVISSDTLSKPGKSAGASKPKATEAKEE